MIMERETFGETSTLAFLRDSLAPLLFCDKTGHSEISDSYSNVTAQTIEVATVRLGPLKHFWEVSIS